MSNVIQFLEVMGRNPGVHGAFAADYAASVALLEIDDAQRQALLARDATALNSLLEGQAKMFCIISTPDEEAPDEAPDLPDAGEPIDLGRAD